LAVHLDVRFVVDDFDLDGIHFLAENTSSRVSTSIWSMTARTLRLYSDTIWTSRRNVVADESNAARSFAVRHFTRASSARTTVRSGASKCA
jgi:hypothetical protein